MDQRVTETDANRSSEDEVFQGKYKGSLPDNFPTSIYKLFKSTPDETS